MGQRYAIKVKVLASIGNDQDKQNVYIPNERAIIKSLAKGVCVLWTEGWLWCRAQQLLDITRALLEEPNGVQEEMHKLQQLKAVLEM